jgi:hypothetical protein
MLYLVVAVINTALPSRLELLYNRYNGTREKKFSQPVKVSSEMLIVLYLDNRIRLSSVVTAN